MAHESNSRNAILKTARNGLQAALTVWTINVDGRGAIRRLPFPEK